MRENGGPHIQEEEDCNSDSVCCDNGTCIGVAGWLEMGRSNGALLLDQVSESFTALLLCLLSSSYFFFAYHSMKENFFFYGVVLHLLLSHLCPLVSEKQLLFFLLTLCGYIYIEREIQCCVGDGAGPSPLP